MTVQQQLSDLQFSIMRVLWELEEARVAEVHQTLQHERGLALTTVATLLSRLEKRGLVSHRTEGRQFVYRATVSEGEVRRSIVSDLTDRVFEGDLPALVSHLLTSREVSSGDLARVRALIENKERALSETEEPETEQDDRE